MAKTIDPLGSVFFRNWLDARLMVPREGARVVVMTGDGRMRYCAHYGDCLFNCIDGVGEKIPLKAMDWAVIEADKVLFWLPAEKMPVGDLNKIMSILGGKG
jgi:hypothetical protein